MASVDSGSQGGSGERTGDETGDRGQETEGSGHAALPMSARVEGIAILHRRHPVTLAKQAIHQMTPNEPGTAGN